MAEADMYNLKQWKLSRSPAYLTQENSGAAIVANLPSEKISYASSCIEQRATVIFSPNSPAYVDVSPPPGLELMRVKDDISANVCDAEIQRFRSVLQNTATAIAASPTWEHRRHSPWVGGTPVAWEWETGMTRNLVPRQSVAAFKQPKFVSEAQRRYSNSRRHSQLILATSLAALGDKHTSCVIYARHVQKLGFNSADILRKHYAKYGVVENVLLSNSHEKKAGAPFRVRVRPSGIALIVMQNKEEVEAILSVGEEQVVNGCTIRLRHFEERGGHPNVAQPDGMLLKTSDNVSDTEIDTQFHVERGQSGDTLSRRSTSFGDNAECGSTVSSD